MKKATTQAEKGRVVAARAMEKIVMKPEAKVAATVSEVIGTATEEEAKTAVVGH